MYMSAMELLMNAVCGGMAGMAVDSVLFPLDTIKTRLQARNPVTADVTGTKSFYRGLLSAMLGSFPSAATFWMAYEQSKHTLTPLVSNKDYMFLVHATSAALADVAVCAVRNPFEVIKQQMQAGLHTTTRTAFSTILKSEGMRGLYAGYFSTVVREIPFDAVEFTLYESMKGSAGRDKQLFWWHNAAFGFIAGGIAAAVTTPLDVIKTRMMTQTKVGAAVRYHGWLHAAKTMYKEEGFAVFWKGIAPRVAWISLGGAIFIGSFEEIKRQAQKIM